MATFAENPAAQRLITGLASVGADFPDPAAVDEDAFRVESVRFLNMLNQLLGDGAPITTVDGPALQGVSGLINEKLKAPDEHGKTPLQYLKALVDGDTEFLVENVTGRTWGVSNQGYARDRFNQIFRSSGTRAENAVEALEFAAENDEDIAKLLTDLRTHAPDVLRNLPEAVALLEGSDDLMADLQTLVDEGLYTGHTINPGTGSMPTAQEYQAAVTTLERLSASTSADGAWDETDARAMQALFRTMQNDGYYGQGWTGAKNGIYDAAWRAHLDAKLAAMPDTDPRKEHLTTMLASIDVLASRSQSPTPPPPDIRSATRTVEESLLVLAPKINETLEDAQASMSGQGGLAELFQSFAQVGILEHRIPEISGADENFDLRSQAALQGLMVFLSDPMVMDIPGENNWYYTPEKGQFILANIDNLKTKIKGLMGEEKYNESGIEEMLTRDNLLPLIESLDFLASQDPPRISQQLLFNQGSVVAAPYTTELFQSLISVPEDPAEIESLTARGAHRIAGMSANNPDMLKLMEVMTREFTGQFGILDIMPDLEGADALGEIDGTATRQQRIADLYKSARAKHAENGHGATLDDDLFIMISTINTLPFGNSRYRRDYLQVMREAIDAAGDITDPDEAARVFSERVTQGMDRLHNLYGQPSHTQVFDRDAPAWKPGLENMTITSGGETFTASQMATFYDNFHIMAAGNPFQDQLGTDFLEMQGAAHFKDDEGNMYVSGIDKQSMIFSVEKIDIARVTAIYEDESISLDDRIEQMIEADPGFALLAGIWGDYGAMNAVFNQRIFDNAQNFNTISEHYQRDVDAIREGRDAAQAERDAYIPPYARSTTVSESKGEQTTAARFQDAAQEPSVFDDQTRTRTQILSDLDALRNFANDELNSSPRVIMAHETGIMDMLRRNDITGADGRSIELPVGNYPGVASLRVKHIDLPPEGTTGQMLSYFDFENNTIRVIPMPDYLVDPAQRAELMSMTGGSDTEAFMRGIKENYPELFNAIQEYRTGGYGGGVTSGPIGRNEYTQFKESMRGFLRSIERDIVDHAYVEPGEVRTPDTFWDNMRDAGQGVANAPGRMGRHIGQYFEPIEDGEIEDTVRAIPQRIEDGFITAVGAIGSRAGEAYGQVTGEREYPLSHQVKGVATEVHGLDNN